MAPEEVQRFNRMWASWWAEGSREGWMLDASRCPEDRGRIVDADTVTDGPLVEGGDVVRGYVNGQADTLDTAAELAKSSSVL